MADRYSGNCDFPAGRARQRLSLPAKQGDDRGASGAETGNPDAQGGGMEAKPAKPGGGRRQRVAAEGLFARFSRIKAAWSPNEGNRVKRAAKRQS
ncbi:MAG: hypothetical protein CR217_09405 [Beijerinckiaceae bacterium]|nr:MAG: hypothetical protein CR217_09405 [Beijerinckiaceae bacterium]